jgi:hypothetical protein
MYLLRYDEKNDINGRPKFNAQHCTLTLDLPSFLTFKNSNFYNHGILEIEARRPTTKLRKV